MAGQLRDALSSLSLMIAISTAVLGHIGYILRDIGIVRDMNVVSAAFKGIVCVAASLTAFWMGGYAFLHIDGGATWPGYIDPADFDGFLHQAVVLSLLAHPLSGATTERLHLFCLCAMVFVTTLVMHPLLLLLVRSGWSILDPAGIGTLHLATGCVTLVTLKLGGSRFLRDGLSVFQGAGKELVFPGNIFITNIGTLLIQAGWMGVLLSTPDVGISARRVIAAVLAMATSGVLSTIIVKQLYGITSYFDVGPCIIGALVAILPCAYIHVFYSFVVGAVAAAGVLAVIHLRERLKLDDVVESVAVHGVGGLWGLIATYLFRDDDIVPKEHKDASIEKQLLLIVCVVWVSCFTAGVVCSVCKALHCLRWGWTKQVEGLDKTLHTAKPTDGSDTDSTGSVLSIHHTSSTWKRSLGRVTLSSIVVAMFITSFTSAGLADAQEVAFTTQPNTTIEAVEVALAMDGINQMWLLVTGFMVLLMQVGFAFIEVGSVRMTSVHNIMFKNVGDTSITAIMWWAVGYGLAYGNGGSKNAFSGTGDFFLRTNGALDDSEWSRFFASYAFASCTCTIVSGAVAERIQVLGYYGIVAMLSGVCYPLLVHWVWSVDGWLSFFNESPVAANGLLDYSGSAVVHITGGTVGLLAAWYLGPRTLQGDLDIFSETGKAFVSSHSPKYSMAIGTTILWFTWLSFNANPVVFSHNPSLAALACTNTVLAGAAASMTGVAVSKVYYDHYSLDLVCSSLLGGLVSITSGSVFMESGFAVATGGVAGIVYFLSKLLVHRLRIDDVIDVGAVHAACGIWGTVATGLFADEALVERSLGRKANGYGAFLGGGGTQLGVQLLGVVVVLAWSAVWTMVVVIILAKIPVNDGTMLRVNLAKEIMGIDRIEHGCCFNFLEQIEAERDMAREAVEVAQDVAQALVAFDLDGAAARVQQKTEEGLRSGVILALDELLMNLREYRPFLPESLFQQQFGEDYDEGTGADGWAMTNNLMPTRDPPDPSDVTIIFTDIQGSTELWEESPQVMGRSLKLHNTILRAAIQKFNGYEVKTIGDAFMVAFDTVFDAVSFAMEVQMNLLGADWDRELLTMNNQHCGRYDDGHTMLWNGLRVRMGIHVGTTTMDTNEVTGRADYFGPAVNKTARIEAASVGGLVILSEEAMSRLNPQHLEELGNPVVLDLGAITLKGITGNQQVTGLIPQPLQGRSRYVLKVVAKAQDVDDNVDNPLETANHPSSNYPQGRLVSFSKCDSFTEGMNDVGKPAAAVKITSNTRSCKGSIVYIRVSTRIASSAATTERFNKMIIHVGSAAQKVDGLLLNLFGSGLTVAFNLGKPNRNFLRTSFVFAAQLKNKLVGANIGISSGNIFHGNVGGQRLRFSATVGDVVDLAYSMSSVAANVQAYAVWCEETSRLANIGPFLAKYTRLLDRQTFPGCTSQWSIFEMDADGINCSIDIAATTRTDDYFAPLGWLDAIQDAMNGNVDSLVGLLSEWPNDTTLQMLTQVYEHHRHIPTVYLGTQVDLENAPSQSNRGTNPLIPANLEDTPVSYLRNSSIHSSHVM